MSEKEIKIFGAREHNLKDINLTIPRNQLVVITGLSGSGKSSLAFDTLYAEGQRRYIETFSAYVRNFLGNLERPDVDKIDGLSPVIAIEQKTTSKNPRSTVGTVTEIYDFLRLLYARVSTAYSYNTNEKMVAYSVSQIEELILKEYQNKKILLLAPLVRARKGHYRELFDSYIKKGYDEFRVDGQMLEGQYGMKLDRYKTHDIELVVDKWKIGAGFSDQRVSKSIETALQIGDGLIMIIDLEEDTHRYFSRNLMCPTTGISYPLPEPNTFSFNSPKGACPTCDGLATIQKFNISKLIPDTSLSIQNGGIEVFNLLKKKKYLQNQLEKILQKYNYNLQTPIQEFSQNAMNDLLYGTQETIDVNLEHAQISTQLKINFEGLIPYLQSILEDKMNMQARTLKKNYTDKILCPNCEGMRLKKQSLFFRIGDKNLSEVAQLPLADLADWVNEINNQLSEKNQKISQEIQKEISTRLGFLLDIGLDYLSLDRTTRSLSGGESQRIRLATQIGTELVNVLYILDEPSIGLHQRDNQRLIQSLQRLRDLGNSVIVVEHDKDMIEQSDYVIDMGPRAGNNGGEVVWHGKPQDIKKAKSITADYFNGKKSIPLPDKRRKGNGEKLELKGSSGNNLKDVTIQIPLGTLTVVTGVSGSGKSTLINETLYPILRQHFHNSHKIPLPYKQIKGIDHLDKVVDVDQSPIGRTPRSNPATYTGVYSDIRNLFTQLPESKIRGYKPGRFSFNVKEGRCATCEGAGVRTIEMNFLPDVYVNCTSCQAKRFNRETLEIRYKGKSISDVLDMSVDSAVDFFQPIPSIYNKLKTLQDVGLGYITLGQRSTTLSGGEAQRVKLATELAKKQTGKTLYILDEPTTGLHFEDIRILMEVIDQLVNLGNSVIIIEHNMDVIKLADHIIDLGLEGGKNGGMIIAEGTPEKVIKNPKSFTAQFLSNEM